VRNESVDGRMSLPSPRAGIRGIAAVDAPEGVCVLPNAKMAFGNLATLPARDAATLFTHLCVSARATASISLFSSADLADSTMVSTQWKGGTA